MGYSNRAPAQWDVDDLCDLLNDLELKTLVPAFKENAVDGPLLLSLSDAELSSDLGMKPLQIKKLRSKLVPEPAGTDASNVQDARSAPAPAPVVYAAPAPVAQVDTTRYVQASQILQSALMKYKQAGEILKHVTQVEGAQTMNDARLFNRRHTVLQGVANAGQKHETDQAERLVEAANSELVQARGVCPDLPPMNKAHVNEMGGVIAQGIAPGLGGDAVRLHRLKESLESIQQAAQAAQAALQFAQAHAQAPAPAPAYAAAPAPAPAYAAAPAPAPAYAAAPGYPPEYRDHDVAKAVVAGAVIADNHDRRDDRRDDHLVGAAVVGGAAAVAVTHDRREDHREDRREDRRDDHLLGAAAVVVTHDHREDRREDRRERRFFR